MIETTNLEKVEEGTHLKSSRKRTLKSEQTVEENLTAAPDMAEAEHENEAEGDSEKPGEDVEF
jgi:hypothetical protein